MRDESTIRYRRAVTIVTIIPIVGWDRDDIPTGTMFWVGTDDAGNADGFHPCKGLPRCWVFEDQFKYADRVDLAQFADACRTYQAEKETNYAG